MVGPVHSMKHTLNTHRHTHPHGQARIAYIHYTTCVIHVTTARTRSSKTVAQSNWLHRTCYLHRVTTLWRGIIFYALVRKTMHGVIVGKRVRTRRLSDRYRTRFRMSRIFWCDQWDYATALVGRVRTKSRDYTGCIYVVKHFNRNILTINNRK